MQTLGCCVVHSAMYLVAVLNSLWKVESAAQGLSTLLHSKRLHSERSVFLNIVAWTLLVKPISNVLQRFDIVNPVLYVSGTLAHHSWHNAMEF